MCQHENDDVVPCKTDFRRLNFIQPNHPQVPVDARRRAQGHSRRSRRPSGLVHARQASHLPVAMLGGIVEGIGNSIRRLKEGTADLMGNAKQLGSLKYVRAVGYVRRKIDM